MKRNPTRNDIVETYKKRFVQGEVSEIIGKGESECILFCQRVAKNIFNIKDGFAIVPESEHCFNDGVCMISNFTKVVFVFDQFHPKKLNLRVKG